MREIVFDTETTGFSPKKGDRVFEIGMVELINRLPSGKTFRHFVNPERELSADSIRITGVQDHQLTDKPLFKDIVDELIEFVGDSPLIAHNSNFDMSFLNFEMELCGRPLLTNKVIDTLAIAKKKLPGARHSLDALCRRFNVGLLEERDVHGALLDAQLLAEVYVELTGGLQGALVLEDESTDASKRVAVEMAREPLIIEPSAEEKDAHNALLERLEGHSWG